MTHLSAPRARSRPAPRPIEAAAAPDISSRHLARPVALLLHARAVDSAARRFLGGASKGDVSRGAVSTTARMYCGLRERQMPWAVGAAAAQCADVVQRVSTCPGSCCPGAGKMRVLTTVCPMSTPSPPPHPPPPLPSIAAVHRTARPKHAALRCGCVQDTRRALSSSPRPCPSERPSRSSPRRSIAGYLCHRPALCDLENMGNSPERSARLHTMCTRRRPRRVRAQSQFVSAAAGVRGAPVSARRVESAISAIKHSVQNGADVPLDVSRRVVAPNARKLHSTEEGGAGGRNAVGGEEGREE
ncbi:hypothetical protein HYPSUDRAFT_426577 [Hypholoma sublateritium FD-334 SS-4]|uniref:Uncharacterized protein n=1 Tax=Hypholoma sublateritium (strain FD-334 SS-4) TaxID=945553 RepID=A0A0D2Q1H7_HYPSF|nr:hypothetical protein HYPSUDRAFT_426577 [Hypholoma sublateritium FD-334 SS-4]